MKKYTIIVLLCIIVILLGYIVLIDRTKEDNFSGGESMSGEQISGILVDPATATVEEIVSVLYEALPDDGSK